MTTTTRYQFQLHFTIFIDTRWRLKTDNYYNDYVCTVYEVSTMCRHGKTSYEMTTTTTATNQKTEAKRKRRSTRNRRRPQVCVCVDGFLVTKTAVKIWTLHRIIPQLNFNRMEISIISRAAPVVPTYLLWAKTEGGREKAISSQTEIGLNDDNECRVCAIDIALLTE